MSDWLDLMIQFEEGTLSDDEVLDLFGHLVKTGMAWSLQGFYGRLASDLINSGFLSPDGEVLQYVDP